MRIAIDARFSGPEFAGIGIYTRSIINALLRVDKDNEYIILKSIISPQSHPLSDLWDNLYLPLYIKIKKVHLLFSPAYRAPLWKSNFKLVITIHDLSPFLVPQTFPKRFKSYMQQIIKRGIYQADHIIAVSNSAMENILHNFPDLPPQKITAIPHGLEEFARKDFPAETIKNVESKYGIIEPFIFYLGTIEPRKNLERLINAYEIFTTWRKDVPLLVLGGKKGWLSEGIYQRAMLLKDKIRFTGFIEEEDLPVLYSRASLFVFPSLYEGFGLPLLEAMSFGVPIIASDIPTNREVLGEAGYYFPAEDVEALAKCLTKLWDDEKLRMELSEVGRKKIEDYSWDKAARKLKSVFEEMLK